MVTVATELTRALAATTGDFYVLFGSREPVPTLEDAGRWVLSPHRHEVQNKLGWLRRAEAAAGVDAMLYPYWPQPAFRLPAAPPAVDVIHDLAYRLRPREVPWQQRLYLGWLMPAAVRSSAALLAVSQTTAGDLLSAYGAAARPKLRVMPVGPTPLPAPGRLPPDLTPGFLLAVSTVEPRKNYDRLLDAYELLHRRGAEVPALVVAGREGWGRQAAATVARLRSAAGVVYLGHVDDPTLSALYRDARALAMVSLYEGFGMPVLDALSRGLPVVVSRRGSLPEVAGDAGIYVDPDDPRSIAGGLAQALTTAPPAAAAAEQSARYTWTAAGEVALEALERARRSRHA